MMTDRPVDGTTFSIRAVGEGAARIRWHCNDADPIQCVGAVVAALDTLAPDWLIDCVPAYDTLLVVFNPLVAASSKVRHTLRQLAEQAGAAALGARTEHRLPVYYAVDVGEDLAALAASAGLTIDQVIALHADRSYTVQAIGFAPGFAYLGPVDGRIATPRRATPRTMVPAGAVGIAENHTAVYPAASPGGWNLIGRCPVSLFDVRASPPMVMQVGDEVIFEPIERERFFELGGTL